MYNRNIGGIVISTISKNLEDLIHIGNFLCYCFDLIAFIAMPVPLLLSSPKILKDYRSKLELRRNHSLQTTFNLSQFEYNIFLHAEFYLALNST